MGILLGGLGGTWNVRLGLLALAVTFEAVLLPGSRLVAQDAPRYQNLQVLPADIGPKPARHRGIAPSDIPS